jgi:sulfur carrier protein ThiS
LEQPLKILFINNDGSGFADHIDINEGRTVGELFAERVTNPDPSAYLIRVNRQPCAKEQVLQEGDRVSITPTKIEGAAFMRVAI